MEDQHHDDQGTSDQATPYVPPEISTHRPTDYDHFSIRGRRL